jgi:hypothetical protein
VQLTRDEHLAKSRQNENFVASLDTSSTVGVEWAITIKFYAALHFVQAYFASRGGHTPSTHGSRASAIERDIHISGAYEDYRELEDLSRTARYDYSNLHIGHITSADECLTAVKAVVGIHL